MNKHKGASSLESLKIEADRLKSQLEQHRQSSEAQLESKWGEHGKPSPHGRYAFQVVRRLAGHHGKISALDWAGDGNRIVSASQDGKLLIWNAMKEVKTLAITLPSPWVMSCAFEQQSDKFVAAGGLDNTCGIFTVSNVATATITEPTIELTGHEGYLSCCRFLNSDEILTSSGDSNCILWDVNTAQRKALFSEHAADVMSVSLHPSETAIFTSGSCDGTVRVWDTRCAKPCTHTFYGHDSDVNSVDFGPSGNTIASASDDSTCRIFDVRSRGAVRIFSDKSKVGSCVTSCAYSKSGALLFAGYEDHTAVAWETSADTLKFHELGVRKSQTPSMDGTRGMGHTNRVSCLGINSRGQALATGSWDQSLLIWSHGTVPRA